MSDTTGNARPEAGLSIATVLVLVGVVAALARWLGYTGFFGSDEVTYVASAFKVLDGDWTLDDYVGANRLGVNLPMAAFGALLGRNELGAAAYSVLCSIGEVLLVTWVAWRMFGVRAALFAGLLCATLPTHVHVAGRIMADSPLALFITGTFVLFFEGELRRRWWPYVAAGLCAGLSFLIKPATMIVFAVLLLYPLVERRWDWRWMGMAAGLAAAMLFNGLLYLALTGRFWYVFENVGERQRSGYLEAGVAAGEIHDDPWFYIVYLFGKVYHTGLVGPLALAGAVWLLSERLRGRAATARATAFVLLWAVGLIVLLSLLPVSFRPLIFIPKQTNYMLMFVAPLCVLGGAALALASLALGRTGLGLAVVGGMAFGLLLQASVAVFTANSWVTLEFVKSHPAPAIHVMSNAYRAAQFQRLVGGTDVASKLAHAGAVGEVPTNAERWIVIDAETLAWDDSAPLKSPAAHPACWEAAARLQGRPAGVGARFVSAVAVLSDRVPALIGEPVRRRAVQLASPSPAVVYRIPPGCPGIAR